MHSCFRCCFRSCENLDTQTYGAHHLDSIIGRLEHLDRVVDLFWHLDTKIYGAQHLDSIIGQLKLLDLVSDLFWNLDTKTYGGHHLDYIIGHLVHLDLVFVLFWHLDTKIYSVAPRLHYPQTQTPGSFWCVLQIPNLISIGKSAVGTSKIFHLRRNLENSEI